MRLSIFGLGYVGSVCSVCLARHGHTIIGVDTNEFKVESLNRGVSPIVEPDVTELLKEALSLGRLSATGNALEAIKETDISLLCVGTPSKPNGGLDLDYVFRVAEEIGIALREKPTFHGVVLRSTALPGTVEKVARIIEQQSGKKEGEGFGIASNPEFLREGTSVFDFDNPPYVVVGTSDPRMISMLRDVYASVQAPFHVVRIREAELLKYVCNSFHAVKVAFANEIGAISKSLSIDSHVVMKLFTEDTKLNISPAYLKPGFAFGGSCLPKDVRALTHLSKIQDIGTPLLDSLIPSNEVNIQRVVEWLVQRKKKNVGVLGLSFKHDTDDLRESPMVKTVETLFGKGFSISIFDSNVSISKLVGANRSYIEQEIPHISSLMRPTIQDVLDRSDVILIGNKTPVFKEALSAMKPGQVALDLVRITEDFNALHGSYEGIGW